MQKHIIKPNWLKDIKVLVWDVDGTFYNSQNYPAYKKAFNAPLWQYLKDRWHISLSQVKKRFNTRKKNLGGITVTLLSFGIGDINIIEEKIYKNIDFTEYFYQDKSLLKMFKELKKLTFLKQAILSNNSKKVLQRKLKVFNISYNYFDWVFTTYDYNLFKPDLKAFELVLQSTKYPAKQHLFISDSLVKDLLPAKKLGMRTCLVWGKSKQADISLEKVYDVVKLWQ